MLFGWGRRSRAKKAYTEGLDLFRRGALAGALEKLQQAVEGDGSVATHHYQLANVLNDLGRLGEARERYLKALEIDPAHAQALNNLAVTLQAEGRDEEALERYRQAADADPSMVAALTNLAVLLWRAGRKAEAAEAMQRAVAASHAAPDLLQLGNAFQGMGHHDQALQAYGRALAAEPGLVEARKQRAASLLQLGFAREAIDEYTLVLEAAPDDDDAARRRLLSMSLEDYTVEEMFAAQQAFCARFAVVADEPAAARDDGERGSGRLRIGYVSADFRDHPVGVLLLPIIESHDKQSCEVYFYSDAERPDSWTERFRARATGWRDVLGCPDAELAGMIRRDRIDVLVIAAGRFDSNRILLGRMRAAPVQVTIADIATSGFPHMDYLIADRGMVPRRSREKFTERVACPPTFYVSTPFDDLPPTASPFERNGYLTFGAFNLPAKNNERTIQTWARLLAQVPDARMLFQYTDTYANAGARSRVSDLFARHGIAPGRLLFAGPSPEHRLARYAPADVAVDPFPFNGITTTLEPLWMGVPVICLEGDRLLARQASSILRKLGLPELVASSEDGYVAIGARLASQPEELRELRRTLRARLGRSPFFSGRSRARQLERLYRAMLRTTSRSARHPASTRSSTRSNPSGPP